MTEVRIQSAFLRTMAVFKAPIVSWPDVPARFFRTVYDALNEVLFIVPGDLVATGGASLGDVSAVLRVFGGNSTLTLRSNMVIAEFPTVTADRIEFVSSIVVRGYQALLGEFKEIRVATITSQAGYQLLPNSLPDTSNALTYSPESVPNIPSEGDIILEYGKRLRMIDRNGTWACKILLEKSETTENGLYLHRETVLSDITKYPTPEKQAQIIDGIDQRIFSELGLEFPHDS